MYTRVVANNARVAYQFTECGHVLDRSDPKYSTLTAAVRLFTYEYRRPVINRINSLIEIANYKYVDFIVGLYIVRSGGGKPWNDYRHVCLLFSSIGKWIA